MIEITVFFDKIKLEHKYNTCVLKDHLKHNIKMCNLYWENWWIQVDKRQKGYEEVKKNLQHLNTWEKFRTFSLFQNIGSLAKHDRPEGKGLIEANVRKSVSNLWMKVKPSFTPKLTFDSHYSFTTEQQHKESISLCVSHHYWV